MHNSWIVFLEKVNKIISELNEAGIDMIYFRGHAEGKWELLPSILREDMTNKFPKINYIESCLYYDFITNAGNLLSNKEKSWDTLYLMRHHGLPTRLLDWSENFATALYFAIESNVKLNNPVIWILDPHALNSINFGKDNALLNPDLDLDYNYQEAFIEENIKIDGKKEDVFEYPLAIYPSRNNDRIFAQRGLFTIHGSKIDSINNIAKKCLQKVEIPKEAIDDARVFLRLAGINEYSIYRDLDSLARHLKKHHNY
jgi:hypothetical protein